MPDVSELLKQIRQAKTDLQNALPELAVLNAINGKALAERKIRDVGFGAKYSGNKVPAWYFLGEELNGAGKTFLANKIKEDAKNTHVVKEDGVWKVEYGEDVGITWGEFRQAQGLQVDHVDLGYTNKMWAGLVPQAPYFEGGKIICQLAGNSVEVINKLSWAFQAYGDFFSKVLTEKEIDIMTAALVEEVRVILINNGFKK